LKASNERRQPSRISLVLRGTVVVCDSENVVACDVVTLPADPASQRARIAARATTSTVFAGALVDDSVTMHDDRGSVVGPSPRACPRARKFCEEARLGAVPRAVAPRLRAQMRSSEDGITPVVRHEKHRQRPC
jgi:hypothetical protein